MSLPEDHMITLQRCIETFRMRDEVVNQIISSTNSQCSNRKVLNRLISGTKNDNQLLGLSILIERLATGDILISDCPTIDSFRNG